MPTDYENQLAIENENLKNEITKLENEFNRYDRVNEYYVQDEVMLVYIQKAYSLKKKKTTVHHFFLQRK